MFQEAKQILESNLKNDGVSIVHVHLEDDFYGAEWQPHIRRGFENAKRISEVARLANVSNVWAFINEKRAKVVKPETDEPKVISSDWNILGNTPNTLSALKKDVIILTGVMYNACLSAACAELLSSFVHPETGEMSARKVIIAPDATDYYDAPEYFLREVSAGILGRLPSGYCDKQDQKLYALPASDLVEKIYAYAYERKAKHLLSLNL